jgi:hypothetical protein
LESAARCHTGTVSRSGNGPGEPGPANTPGARGTLEPFRPRTCPAVVDETSTDGSRPVGPFDSGSPSSLSSGTHGLSPCLRQEAGRSATEVRTPRRSCLVLRRCGTVRPRSEWSIAQSKCWLPRAGPPARTADGGLENPRARHHVLAGRSSGATEGISPVRTSPRSHTPASAGGWPALVAASPAGMGVLGTQLLAFSSLEVFARLAGASAWQACSGSLGGRQGWAVTARGHQAAVMRYGCQRGEFVEGWTRRGEARRRQETAGPAETWRTPGSVRVATHPEPPRGASCRGGEKPRGWNEIVWVAPGDRRVGPRTGPGVDARRGADGGADVMRCRGVQTESLLSRRRLLGVHDSRR